MILKYEDNLPPSSTYGVQEEYTKAHFEEVWIILLFELCFCFLCTNILLSNNQSPQMLCCISNTDADEWIKMKCRPIISNQADYVKNSKIRSLSHNFCTMHFKISRTQWHFLFDVVNQVYLKRDEVKLRSYIVATCSISFSSMIPARL